MKISHQTGFLFFLFFFLCKEAGNHSSMKPNIQMWYETSLRDKGLRGSWVHVQCFLPKSWGAKNMQYQIFSIKHGMTNWKREIWMSCKSKLARTRKIFQFLGNWVFRFHGNWEFSSFAKAWTNDPRDHPKYLRGAKKLRVIFIWDQLEELPKKIRIFFHFFLFFPIAPASASVITVTPASFSSLIRSSPR